LLNKVCSTLLLLLFSHLWFDCYMAIAFWFLQPISFVFFFFFPTQPFPLSSIIFVCWLCCSDYLVLCRFHVSICTFQYSTRPWKELKRLFIYFPTLYMVILVSWQIILAKFYYGKKLILTRGINSWINCGVAKWQNLGFAGSVDNLYLMAEEVYVLDWDKILRLGHNLCWD
jgi:hypothetical protein